MLEIACHFDLLLRNTFVSRHAIFHEHVFPYSIMQQSSSTDSDIISDLNHTLLFDNLFRDQLGTPYMHNEQPVIASTDNDHLTLEHDFNQIQDNRTFLRRSSRSRQLPSCKNFIVT